MTDRYPPPKAAILPFRMTASRAEAIIREAAQDSDNVIYGDHALVRMDERDFSDHDMLGVLRTGIVMQEPTKTNRGEWKCKVVKRLRGVRDVGVVTIILLNGKLFLKTVEWEDWRS